MIIKNKYGEVRSGWALAIIIGVYFLIQIIVQIGVVFVVATMIITSGGDISDYDSLNEALSSTWVVHTLYYAVTLLSIGVSFLFFWLLYKKSPIQLGLFKEKWLSQLLIGCVFGIGAISVVFGVLLISQTASVTVMDWTEGIDWGFVGEICGGVILFVLVGFAEEIMNRGFMMSAMRTTRVKWLIIVLPALLFALLHAMNPNATVLGLANIMLVGILFGYMFVRTGMLWVPIGFHITWNFFQGHVFGLAVSGMEQTAFMQTSLTGPAWFTGGAFGAEGGLLCTLVILLSLVCVRGFMKPKKAFWRMELPEPMPVTDP
ncbi:MAG: CPBP family intramembrane metalloprotease [Peptococcaceae bacterium]|nr:CPBP family intramembrane metalloprotease [Peptococcaceae bacterium]